MRESIHSSKVTTKEDERSAVVVDDCVEIDENVNRGNEKDGRETENSNTVSIVENYECQSDSGTPVLDCEGDVNDGKSENTVREQPENIPESKIVECFDSAEMSVCIQESQTKSTDEEKSLICGKSTIDVSENNQHSTSVKCLELSTPISDISVVTNNFETLPDTSQQLPQNSSSVNCLELLTPISDISLCTNTSELPDTSQQSGDECVNVQKSTMILGTPVASTNRNIKSILKQPGKSSSLSGEKAKKVFIVVPLDKKKRERTAKRKCTQLPGEKETHKKEVQNMDEIEVVYDKETGECKIVSVQGEELTSSDSEDSSKDLEIIKQKLNFDGKKQFSNKGTESNISKVQAIFENDYEKSDLKNVDFDNAPLTQQIFEDKMEFTSGRGMWDPPKRKNYAAHQSNFSGDRFHSRDCVCYLCSGNKDRGVTSHLDRALADVFPEQKVSQQVSESTTKNRTRRADAEDFINYITGRKNETRKRYKKRKRLFHL